MADVILEIKIPDIADIRKRLKGMENQAETAMVRAINKTIDVMKGYIAKEAMENRYKVKATAVKKSLETKKTTRRQLSGYIKSSAKSTIPLKGFQVSPTSSKNKPDVYKSRVMLDHKLAPLLGCVGRSKAFIATMPSNGHVGVYQRVLRDKGREPIKALHGPSIPSMIKSFATSKIIQKRGCEYLKQRIDHEIKYLLGGIQ